MKSKIIALLFIFAAAAVIAAPVYSVVVIKIGSIAPEQTEWGKALNKMAGEWKKITGGEVELKVYHNGVAGGEADVLRKIRIGQLQGGVFTSFGLFEINPDVMSLSIPNLITTDAELDYVLNSLKPYLESKIEQKRFKMLAWSKAGWVKFFSKKPVFVPADLKAQKIAANPDDQAMFQAWKVLGYQQVPVATPEILLSLNSGMIEALYASPIAVGGFQWFGLAKYMLDMPVAPFLGGIVITTETWNRIPEKYREELKKSSMKLEVELSRNVQQMEKDAIKTMQKFGLVINKPTADQLKLWKAEYETGYPKIMGKTFSKDMYDRISKLLSEYKKK